jgi:hypothetical protein
MILGFLSQPVVERRRGKDFERITPSWVRLVVTLARAGALSWSTWLLKGVIDAWL